MLSSVRSLLSSGILILPLLACQPEQPAEDSSRVEGPRAIAVVDAVADELWQRMQAEDVWVQLRYGLQVTDLADLTLEKFRQDAEWASRQLDRLAAISTEGLPRETARTAAYLEYMLAVQRDLPQFFWLDFLIAPYQAGNRLGLIRQVLAAQPLDDAESLDAYLRLLGEYRDLVDQIRAQVEGQIERGIRLPKPALPGAVALLRGFRDGVASSAMVDAARLAGVDEAARGDFTVALPSAIAEVEAAYDALLATLGEDYAAAAPEDVGLGQYPGGEEYYRWLVRFHTNQETTPEQVHAIGLERMAELRAQMAELRDELGFDGTREEFHAGLRTDPRHLATSPEEVEARYMVHVRRIEPLIHRYFDILPRAPYGVRRLEREAEGSMTFGYYQPPTASNPVGEYRYNGSSLSERPLLGAASLIYHELIPGHHFQVALQSENEDLPPVRREGFISAAYTEGWAEYAASLAWEMDLYDDPYDAYGRLLGDAFLTSRLVLDTGMNHLGWSLEKAREYMRSETFLSELEVRTETLRYSTDIPGQALGYKMGHLRFDALRAKGAEALGESFDLRHFHALILKGGPLPLDVLEEDVNLYISEASAADAKQ